MSAVAFVKSENDILDCPMWVLIVNVVAMDMLKSKLPPGELGRPLRVGWNRKPLLLVDDFHDRLL